MRTTISLIALGSLLGVAAVGGQGASQPAATNASPAMARVGTMSELMVHIIYPTSDAVFYISSRTPTTDAEWAALQASTLTLAESANLLMMPGRTRPGQWDADSRMMLDAAWGAFKAAKEKNVEGVEAVSDQLYESCVSCHKAYRPDYGKPKPPPVSVSGR
jgi:cytochrome c556